MSGMFCDCSRLHDISALASWNVSNVKNMHSMFNGCRKLQDISPIYSWDINKVTDTNAMFLCCHTSVDLSPLLDRNGNHNKPIFGSPTLLFRQEIDRLTSHVTRLEERIVELTEIIERKQKEESDSWYQPLIDWFSSD
jgi:hypothetical protein